MSITREEVKRAVYKIKKNGKAFGVDEIPAEVFKIMYKSTFYTK